MLPVRCLVFVGLLLTLVGNGCGSSSGSNAGSGGSAAAAAGGSGAIGGISGSAGVNNGGKPGIGGGGAGGVGGALPPSPSTLTTGTWMLYDVQRTPDAGTCYATLIHLEVSSTRLLLGERRIECDGTTDDFSNLDFTVSGNKVSLGGQTAGTFDQHTLDVTLPVVGGSVHLDLTQATDQYQESEPGVGATVTYSASMTKMPDERPIALPITTQGSEDVALNGQLRAARLPTSTLTYAVTTQPGSGALKSVGATTGAFAYLGNLNFNGTDTFGFSVNDGVNPATDAAVTVQLGAINDPPVTKAQSASVVEDTSTPIALNASDADGDSLTFTVVTPPSHGTLSGTGPVMTYLPNSNYNGADSFQYVASDAVSSANTSTVSITVTPVNDPPVASDVTVTTKGTNRVVAVLKATDPDNTSFTYTISRQPAHGAVSGTFPNATYRATAGFTGDDSFGYTASDGQLSSAEATVTVHVLPNPYTSATLSTTPTDVCPILDTGSALYFAAQTTMPNGSIWVTDGTSSGTHSLFSVGTGYFQGEIQGHAFSIGSSDCYAIGYWLYSLSTGALLTTFPNPDSTRFSAGTKFGTASVQPTIAYLLIEWADNSGQIASEIWSTDGTAAGTVRLYQLPITAGPYVGIVDYAGSQYFAAGTNLMAFQGATQAPALVKALPAGTVVQWMVPAGGLLFFEADEPSTSSGGSPVRELWKTDGTAAGTAIVATIDSSFISYGASSPTAFNSKLYYGNRTLLYTSDGTTVSTVATLSVSLMWVVNSKLFIWGGSSPWVSDGTSAGTSSLNSVVGMTHPNYAYDNGIAFDALTFFAGDDGVLGPTLWATDFTPAGTEMELDIPTNVALGAVNGRLVVWGCNAQNYGSCTTATLSAVWHQ